MPYDPQIAVGCDCTEDAFLCRAILYIAEV